MEWRVSMGADVRTRGKGRHVDTGTSRHRGSPTASEWSVAGPLGRIRVERDADIAQQWLALAHNNHLIRIGDCPHLRLLLPHELFRALDHSICRDAEVRVNDGGRSRSAKSFDSDNDAVVSHPTVPGHRVRRLDRDALY